MLVTNERRSCARYVFPLFEIILFESRLTRFHFKWLRQFEKTFRSKWSHDFLLCLSSGYFISFNRFMSQNPYYRDSLIVYYPKTI